MELILWRFNWNVHLLTYCIFQLGAVHTDYFTTQWYAEAMSNWPSVFYILEIFCYCSFCVTLLLSFISESSLSFRQKRWAVRKGLFETVHDLPISGWLPLITRQLHRSPSKQLWSNLTWLHALSDILAKVCK